jgi:hypothetical protein
LLFTQIGSELHAGAARNYLIVLIWALIAHFLSFLVGVAAHIFLGMPDWITASIMFNKLSFSSLLDVVPSFIATC